MQITFYNIVGELQDEFNALLKVSLLLMFNIKIAILFNYQYF